VEHTEKTIQQTQETITPAAGNRFYSPLVLNIAKAENISMAVLETIAGTGAEGRVTKRDILAFVQNKGNVTPSAPQTTSISTTSTPKPVVSASVPPRPPVSLSGGDEIIEMDRMRKLIADHMVMSKHTSPHVTSFVEADVTNMVVWRDKAKKVYEKREGEKITFTPMFIECVAKAIKDFPMINVSVDGNNIIKRKNINIGMAAALPTGNLIVPVIKSADGMNLLGLTKSVNDLANRARANKLAPDDIQGGTFTLTNVGGFGNVMGTPIINQPQVAIMATGSIKKKPAVLETPMGDVIAIRHMMFLSLSYDHRVVDGSLGGSFLKRVADYMEQWDVNREI
jgi:2-oxoglutarate dehydrogenase E2 component (dihydrolipoamide succinyltransferase)